VIEVKEIAKAYGNVQALQDVNFKIAEGEIVGLLGPNGAGKTTIIKTITGYLQPDCGSVVVDGLDVMQDTLKVQERIGYLPESAPLYPELSVQAYLKMIADLRNVPEDEQVEKISRAVYAVGLENHLVRPIGQLSKGYRQRVGLAQAILHQPKLLILDEPTVGLDPTQIVEIRNLIKNLAKHSTVLFSTHILSEVEMLCDRVIILIQGKVKADALLSELEETHAAIVVLDEPVNGFEAAVTKLVGVKEVVRYDADAGDKGKPGYRIVGKDNADILPEIFRLAAAQNWPLRELRADSRKLESVFNELVAAE
jgi:ABC-2 type transport system ATP-binding protein